jgi:2,3-bisphosphoglycerate-dependent phosphoglycerate mutase
MQLYIIRHAQSFNNALAAEYTSQRHFDPPLTELGLAQARLLAEHLAQTNPAAPAPRGDPQNRKGYGLTHLYASLMARAVNTGSIVAARLGLPLHAWADWHEEGGLYLDDPHGQQVGQPGPARADFARDYPGLVLPEAMDEGGWWNRPYEAEAGRPERARRVLARLLEEHGGTEDNVAVISHGGFFNHFLGALLDLQPPYALTYLTNNTSISRLSIGPSNRYMVYQNRCEHLPAEMTTY